MKPTSTLDDVELFVTVVASSSLSEAGRRLGLTPSSVARRMDDLEAELGVRLLTRTTRRLGLTEAGAAFHERAARVAADLAEAKAMVAGFDAEPRGTLRVDASVAFGSRHIAPVLGQLAARFPDLCVELTLNDRHVDLVHEGVDLAIRLGILPDSGVVAGKLAPLRRVVVASPDYLARRGIPDRPEALADHECLVMHCASAARSWHFVAAGRGLRTYAVSGRVRTNNAEALVAAAVGGAGLAHLPTWLVHEHVQAGRLIPLLQAFEASSAEQGGIYTVRPAARVSSAKVQAFNELLRERWGHPTYWDRAFDSALEDPVPHDQPERPVVTTRLRLVGGVAE